MSNQEVPVKIAFNLSELYLLLIVIELFIIIVWGIGLK